jgi:predicted hydrocarbon binding protein
MNLLDEIEYEGDSGSLLYRGVRYLLIRPETIVGFQKHIEEKFGSDAAREAMFAGGFQGGKLSAERYMKEFKLEAKDVLEFMCSMGTALGWGKMEWSWDRMGDKIIVRVHNSPFARSYGSSERGVCYLVEGVFAGIGEVIFGGAKSEERKCVAKGDDFCEFVIQPKG